MTTTAIQLSNAELSELLEIAQKAARIAGELLVKGFSQAKEIQYKGGVHNLVTQFDVASEKAIIDCLRQKYPNHVFLAEEGGGSQEPGGFRWIIDPLDGTVNFAHGIPIFSVSIALEFNEQIVVGVVLQPMTNEMFCASLHNGATLNGEKIIVSKSNSLAGSILVTGFPYKASDNAEHTLDHFCSLVNMGIPIRRLGSAAVDLAYVACGRFDGFWESALQPWDVAAGILLVEEAGGRVTDFSGSRHHLRDATLLSTNGVIHNEFVSFLQS